MAPATGQAFTAAVARTADSFQFLAEQRVGEREPTGDDQFAELSADIHDDLPDGEAQLRGNNCNDPFPARRLLATLVHGGSGFRKPESVRPGWSRLFKSQLRVGHPRC
jgi:hypothetical protein